MLVWVGGVDLGVLWLCVCGEGGRGGGAFLGFPMCSHYCSGTLWAWLWCMCYAATHAQRHSHSALDSRHISRCK